MPVTCPGCHQPLPQGAEYCSKCGADGLEQGLTLKLRYRIDRLIGRGGFGLTYRAIDLSSGELVAIKELYPEGAQRAGRDVIPSTTLRLEQLQQQRASFLEVLRAAAQWPHRHLLPVLDVFEQHGTAYAVTPLLKGATLAEQLLRTGPLLGQDARRVAEQLAAALGAVHAAGYLHRDLKPDNVFLCDDGRAVLMDLDSLQPLEGEDRPVVARLVSAGYSPIEQYAGSLRGSAAADLYALGATLYHAVQGQPPPPATDLVTGSAALQPFAASVDAGLVNAISCAMAMRAIDRPQSVQAFLELLHQSALPSGTEVQPPLTFKAHTSAVTALVYDGRGLLLSTSEDHTARLWALTDLRSAAPMSVFHDHHDAVRAGAYSASAGWITGGDDGQAVVRQTRDRDSYARRLPHAEAVVAMSTTAERLACATRDRYVQIWSLAEEARLAKSERLPHWPTALHYTPDGAGLFVGLQDGRLFLLHGGSTRLLAERRAHEGRITALTSLPGVMYSAGADGHLRCWTLLGELLADVPVSHAALQGLAADPGNGRVYVVDAAATLYQVDAATFEAQRRLTLPGEPGALTVIGTTLFAGLSDGRITTVPLT